MRLVVAAVILSSLATGPGRAEAVGAEEERAAKALNERATRAFHRGDYDRAIVYYKQAHARAAAPALLFNIAQAYRAKHDRANALRYYEAYLREDPVTAERRFVEARIAELRARPPGQLTSATPPAADRAASPGLRAAGAVTAGVGAVLAGAGLVSAIQASSRTDGAIATGDGGSLKAAQARAVVFTASGVVAMVTGGVMFYVGSQPVRVAPALSPGSAGLQVSGAF